MPMREFIKVIKALRDPNRVKIIKILEHGKLCVCEIQEVLQVSQSTASKHLKNLEEAGLLNKTIIHQFYWWVPGCAKRVAWW